MGQMIDEKHEDHMSGSGADSETLSHSDDLHTRNNGKEAKRRRASGSTRIVIEPGEEIEELPYKRPSRRGTLGSSLPCKQTAHADKSVADLTTSTKKKLLKIPQESHVGLPPTAPALSKSNTKKGHGYFSTSSARNLLTSRRIIDSFNVGDLAEIQKIVDDTVTLDCDVYVFPLNQRMRGRNALMDLWESMLEAFPDGVFRASDTTINDKGELTTRFIFTGAKQFNIRLGNTSLCGREFGEIIPIDMQHSNNDGYSYCDSSSSSSSDIGVRSSCSGTLKSISNDDEDAAKTDFHNSNSRIAPHINAKSAMGSRKSKKELSLNNSKTTSNIFEANMATIGVDYSVPLIRSADLLVDDALEEVYRGSMIMHTNGQYQIDRLDYHWTKNP